VVDLAVLSLWLGSIIVEVFSNLDDSMIFLNSQVYDLK